MRSRSGRGPGGHPQELQEPAPGLGNLQAEKPRTQDKDSGLPGRGAPSVFPLPQHHRQDRCWFKPHPLISAMHFLKHPSGSWKGGDPGFLAGVGGEAGKGVGSGACQGPHV